VVVNGTTDLKIDKTGPASATVGTQFEYNITVTNLGPVAAPSVTVTDAVPSGFTNPEFSTDSGSSWATWSGSYTLPGPLANAGTATILLRGTPDCSAVGTLSNTASVTLSPILDTNSGNNSSTVNTTVTDATQPTYTTPVLASGYCVEDIFQAVYNNVPEGDPYDLTYLRPDYFLFAKGFTMLDLSNVADNCALAATNPISWKIDFADGTSLSGNGQLKDYDPSPDPGIKFPVGTNKITYTVTDASGNTSVQEVDLVVMPRPAITKDF
jgi:uncharacterized repeat protein (TIGR01451 family)